MCSFTSSVVTASIILQIVILPRETWGKTYKANILEATDNRGYQQVGNSDPNFSSPLLLKRKPSSFSGPEALRPISQKCFTLVKDQYEWRLCLFQNATQTEVGSSRWNPYRGVLGIWAEWKVDVVTNAFISMSMTDGDDCGSHGSRKVDVKLSCGTIESLASVEEPSTCHYLMTLEAPVFCQSKNLLIYPTLPDADKARWDRAFTEWQNSILTRKGYVRAVLEILSDAGFVGSNSSVSSSERQTFTPVAPHPAVDGRGSQSAKATNEMSATDYKDLLERYERLGRLHAETILELSKCQRDLSTVMGAGNHRPKSDGKP